MQKPYRDYYEIDYITIELWSSDRYGSYEEAQRSGAVRWRDFSGYTAAADAVETACAVADMLQHGSHKDDIRVRIRTGVPSNLTNELPECYLAEAIAALNDLF